MVSKTISKNSWSTLRPTIRKKGSEIWCSFNPVNLDDPIYNFFVDEYGEPIPADDTICLKINHRDNPWFGAELKAEMARDFKTDPERAMHTWEGQCLTNGDAQVFKNKWIVTNHGKK